MDNNKNRLKDRPKSKTEMRKMFFEHGSEIGMVDGKKVGAQSVGAKLTKRSKLSHKKNGGVNDDNNTIDTK